MTLHEEALVESDHNGDFLKRHMLKDPYCGCDVGPGWIPLLDDLVTKLVSLGWDKDLHQVKEKFGGLRFYVGETTETMEEAISQAEEKSWGVCSECGKSGQQRDVGRRTECKECHGARSSL